MKVYTKVVIDMDSGETLEEHSYDYDGPVAEAKGGVFGNGMGVLGSGMGGNTSGGGFLNKMFGTMFGTPQGPSTQPNMGAADPYAQAAQGDINTYQSSVIPQWQNYVNMNTPGNPAENSLFNMESGRYMDALTPKFSGAGLLTSGPGLKGMQQGMSDFTTAFTNDRMGELFKGLTGLGSATAQPASLEEEIMKAMLGQPDYNKPAQPGLLSQLFGGGSNSTYSGMQSAGGGLSSLFSGGGGGAGGGAGGALAAM